ncbi:MAG: aldo/keto reductase [Sedimentisphaerales bacterium]|nr:aldo/keto reductase [Sedimentisphaerales bacterium]
MKRRTFLKAVGGAAGSYYLGSQKLFAAALTNSEKKTTEMPKRTLGKTGHKISIIGFPGLLLAKQSQDEDTKALHDAYEQGINYFDVAPTYNKGRSEISMGIGLQGIDRSKIFISCKTQMRDADGARTELERSLTRLKTDYFDLYQMHCITRPEEVERALGPGGAMETFLKAKEEGKVRYFGFSAHTSKGAIAALKGFKFDTVMFPINFIDFFQMDFGKTILELAKERGMGVIAIKGMYGGAWPQGAQRTRDNWYNALEKDEEINMAMRFTLSQEPVTTAMPPGFLDLFYKAIPVGKSYSKITEPEIQKLREIAKSVPSVFRRMEERLASGRASHEPLYADSPHQCCPYSKA